MQTLPAWLVCFLIAPLGLYGQTEPDLIKRPKSPATATPNPHNVSPAEAYGKEVKVLIGAQWYERVRRAATDANLVSPPVKLAFVITTSGQVENIRLVDGASESDFVKLCRGAILAAKLPPPPKELAPLMKNGKLDKEMTFTFISGPTPAPGK